MGSTPLKYNPFIEPLQVPIGGLFEKGMGKVQYIRVENRRKVYEYDNHLGNVLTTVSDRRKLVCSNQSFEADVINTYDYSPFGAPLPGRSLGALKCSDYTSLLVTEVFNDMFNVSSPPFIVLAPVVLPTTFGWYKLNTLTRAIISNNRLNVTKQGANTNNTRGVAKQFTVLAGKNYTLKFKHYASAPLSNVLFYYRIVDNLTSTVIVPQTSLVANNTMNPYSYLFTPSANATYRIEFYMVGLVNNFSQFRIDDVQIYFEEEIVNQVCVPTGDDYRFGANQMEKDNEVSGQGNSYTAEYWQYDSRLGRRWNLDPKPNYAISPYACFGNNPISTIDHKGDTLTAANITSREDLLSIIKPKNQKYLKFDQVGRASLDFTGVKQSKVDRLLRNDEGLSVVKDIVTSTKKFLYTATDQLLLVHNVTGFTTFGMLPLDNTGIYNMSNGGFDSGNLSNNPEYLPKGYDGHVVISKEGEWYGGEGRKSRAGIIFHELVESYERTALNNNYLDVLDAMGNVMKVGAHNAAIDRQRNWWGYDPDPGQGNFYHTHQSYTWMQLFWFNMKKAVPTAQ